MLDQRTRWRGGKMERDGTLAAGAGGASYAATGSAFEFTDYLRDFQPSRFLLSTAWSYFLLLSDLAAVPAGFVLAFFAAGLVDTQVFGWAYDVRPHEITARFIEFFGLALVLLGWLHRRGHYVRRVMFWTAAGDLLRITVFGMLLDGFAQFALQQNISRTWFLCIWLLLPLVMIGLRVLTRAALDLVGLWQRRVLIAGDVEGARAAQAVLLSDASMGYEIAGRVAIESVTEAGPGLSLAGLMRRHGASLLVFTPEDEAFQLRRAMVAALVRERVDFAIMPAMDGLAAPGFEAQRFFRQDALLLTYRNNAELPGARAIKPLFDGLVALLMVLVLAPVLAVIAIAIKRDGGPVFFAHPRMGYEGRRFGCLKFRTMVMNADQVLRETLARDPRAAAEWAATQKLRRDPRVTAVGRLLRKTSLDELPQLFNVLRGDMSLVGPRPIVEREVARYGDDIAYYYCVRPGLTGLWQVSGRNDTSYGRKVQLDASYVRNWSFLNDLVILLKTVPAVLFQRGAC
jgi:undecaprenyl-phosphate galactose phosphotransferase